MSIETETLSSVLQQLCLSIISSSSFLLHSQGKLGVLIISFYQDVIRDYFGTDEQGQGAKWCRRSKGEAILKEADWVSLSRVEPFLLKWEKQFRRQGLNK